MRDAHHAALERAQVPALRVPVGGAVPAQDPGAGRHRAPDDARLDGGRERVDLRAHRLDAAHADAAPAGDGGRCQRDHERGRYPPLERAHQSWMMATARVGPADPDDLQRKAAHGEPGRRQLAQVAQPLDLAVVQARLVRGPEHPLLPTPESLLRLQVQRGVPAPSVDSHYPDSTLVQRAGCLRGDAAAVGHVVRLPVERVAAGSHEDDVARGQVVAGGRERLLGVRRRHRLPVRLVRHVQDHPRPMEPLQRQFVDGAGALAPDPGVVVPGRVDVRRVVRPEAGERLDRPALPVAQQVGPDAEQPLDLRRAPGVVLEHDVRAQGLGQVGGARLDRRGQVYEARHGRREGQPDCGAHLRAPARRKTVEPGGARE